MTKAERIRKLAEKHPEWRPKQIAALCDCLPSYVRVVLRQRTLPGGMSESDIRYDAKIRSEHGTSARCFFAMRKYRSDPEYRAKSIAAAVRWRRENNKYRNEYLRAHYARKKAERAASAPA